MEEPTTVNLLNDFYWKLVFNFFPYPVRWPFRFQDFFPNVLAIFLLVNLDPTRDFLCILGEDHLISIET